MSKPMLPTNKDRYWGASLNNYLLSLKDSIDTINKELSSRTENLTTITGVGFTLGTYNIYYMGEDENKTIKKIDTEGIFTLDNGIDYYLEGDVTYRVLEDNTLRYTTKSFSKDNDNPITLFASGFDGTGILFTDYNSDGSVKVPSSAGLTDDFSFYNCYLYFDAEDAEESYKAKVVFSYSYVNRPDFILIGTLRKNDSTYTFIPRTYSNSKTLYQSTVESMESKASLFDFVKDDGASGLKLLGTSFSSDFPPFTNPTDNVQCTYIFNSNGVSPKMNLQAKTNDATSFKYSDFDNRTGIIYFESDKRDSSTTATEKFFIDSDGTVKEFGENDFKENHYYSYFLGIDGCIYVMENAYSGSYSSYYDTIPYPPSQFKNLRSALLVFIGSCVYSEETKDGVISKKYHWETAKSNGISPVLNPSAINWNQVLVEDLDLDLYRYNSGNPTKRTHKIKIKENSQDSSEIKLIMPESSKLEIPVFKKDDLKIYYKEGNTGHTDYNGHTVDFTIGDIKYLLCSNISNKPSTHGIFDNWGIKESGEASFKNVVSSNRPISTEKPTWEITNGGEFSIKSINSLTEKVYNNWYINSSGRIYCSSIECYNSGSILCGSVECNEIGNSNDKWSITNSGDITCNSVTYTSDRRYKKNIQPLSINCMDIVKALDVKTYTYTETEKDTLGIIAQDIEEVMPELAKRIVHEDEKGKKVVEEHKLLFILWQAVKELINK